ncbi:RHS repeat-associated core domain-containing protein [Pseudomonas putida]|uniref:RHS repeat-associated core domain-containing protein n=1 Tax=Pseudomonas putida TaxID=303 RepID=UPI0009A23D6E|nr:RHS repeat-associated core domain-containing protein [Pseudomonas putida]
MTGKQQNEPTEALSESPQALLASTLRFYQGDRLATEKSLQGSHRIMWSDESAVAQHNNVQSAKLLRTDLSGSVIGMQLSHMVYAPYGHRATDEMAPLIGFNGQREEISAGGYLLGNGRRLYNTKLMRFTSQDELSPFGKGGSNSYSYCQGDPINWEDPSGNFMRAFQSILRSVTRHLIKFGTDGLHSRKLVQAPTSVIAQPKAGAPSTLNRGIQRSPAGIIAESTHTFTSKSATADFTSTSVNSKNTPAIIEPTKKPDIQFSYRSPYRTQIFPSRVSGLFQVIVSVGVGTGGYFLIKHLVNEARK